MKKILITLVLLFVAANADTWHKINTYESVLVKEDVYQVKLLNGFNLLENNLQIDKANDTLIKEGTCEYHSLNDKTFDFIGDGSIRCENNTSINFISQQYLETKDLSFQKSMFALAILFLPMAAMLVYFIFHTMYLLTGKGVLVIIGLISFILVFVYLFIVRDNFGKYVHKIHKDIVKQSIAKGSKADNKIYYVDPKMLFQDKKNEESKK